MAEDASTYLAEHWKSSGNFYLAKLLCKPLFAFIICSKTPIANACFQPGLCRTLLLQVRLRTKKDYLFSGEHTEV